MSEISKSFLERYARGLRSEQARLYDQFGLRTLAGASERDWTVAESSLLEEQALRIAAAALSVSYSDKRLAVVGFRRAAELFEWLIPERADEDIRLVCAALYQLADLPAMAKSVIDDAIRKDDLLIPFLGGDFQTFERRSADFTAVFGSKLPRDDESEDVPISVSRHLHASLNQIVAALKWSDIDGIAAVKALAEVAQVFNGASDAMSWLLSTLVLRISESYLTRSLREVLRGLEEQITSQGSEAIERYIRSAYVNDRSLLWPTQRAGIALVLSRKHFALCTPTGSGKTTIAELAILQTIYSALIPQNAAPIALYVVPSRALAADVERRLASSLKHSHVNIISSYGGFDLSVVDETLLSPEPAVVVCTQEKADSLIRVIGNAWLSRISLVVIDEAHNVQVHSNQDETRGYRLEQLIARLRRRGRESCRFIALSAVTSRIDQSIEKWLGSDGSTEATDTYQSTRRVFGRLNFSTSGNFSADYDLLNGSMLGDENLAGFRPRLPDIVSRFPYMNELRVKGKRVGPEIELRTAAFWAAVQLTRKSQGAVLITVGSRIEVYAKAFLESLERWDLISELEISDDSLAGNKDYLFALSSCMDYFGKESFEYRLLKLGIIVHHGRLPTILQRRFTSLIEGRSARICLATSTLSEGVNLPFETILLPSLRGHGGSDEYPAAELRNLVGRAGRPGKSREGRALVLMGIGLRFRNHTQLYQNALSGMRGISDDEPPKSALLELLRRIHQSWVALGSPLQQFERWLESINCETLTDEKLVDSLDDLDNFLLALFIEDGTFAEQMNPADTEALLSEVWRLTYAYAVSGTDRSRYLISKWNALTIGHRNAQHRGAVSRTS